MTKGFRMKKYSDRFVKVMISTIVKHDKLEKPIVSNWEISKLKNRYSEIRSMSAKNSYSKWKQSMGQKETSFSDRAKLGMITWSIKHDMSGSDEELLEFARKNMKGSNHGEKIKNGINALHNDVSKEYHRRMVLRVSRYHSVPLEQVDDKLVKSYYRDIKFGNQNVLEWKRAHLSEEYADSPSALVEAAYSEYISDRFKASQLEYQNGYLRTQREWYTFRNIEKKLFCRSSWEIKFCEFCDTLLERSIITEVSVPNRIKYFREDVKQWRHYYPDFEVKTKDRTFTIEIKPLFRCDEQVNKDKFYAASTKYKDDFVIVTEHELKLEKLEKLFNGENKWNS